MSFSKTKKCGCLANCGQDEEQRQSVSLHDLDEDVQLHIFKYLSLEDRPKLELVNTNFRALVQSLWLQQKVLSFGRSFELTTLCDNKTHLVRQKDCIDGLDNQSRFQLIRKCPNLVVLIWNQASTEGNTVFEK